MLRTQKDFHTRNKPGQRQRETVSNFGSGSRSRPAFRVNCEAKAIIHGTLNEASGTPATLLVYDFSFLSYRPARIKDARIEFKFKSQGNDTGLEVQSIAPTSKHVVMQTIETETRKTAVGGNAGATIGASLELSLSNETSVEKQTTHAAEISGLKLCNDYGDHYGVEWWLKENESQKSGIVSILRTCILLTRDTDKPFDCIPEIKVTPDLKTWLVTLVSRRPRDEPIILDPEYEPFNCLESTDIDSNNLDAVDLDDLWDCTFHKTFDGAVKHSRPTVVSVEETKEDSDHTH